MDQLIKVTEDVAAGMELLGIPFKRVSINVVDADEPVKRKRSARRVGAFLGLAKKPRRGAETDLICDLYEYAAELFQERAQDWILRSEITGYIDSKREAKEGPAASDNSGNIWRMIQAGYFRLQERE